MTVEALAGTLVLFYTIDSWMSIVVGEFNGRIDVVSVVIISF
jgi:hypothetical protein